MPADNSWGGIQDLLLVLMAVRVGEVVGPNQNDHHLGHVVAGELPACLQAPQQIPRLVPCASHMPI